MQRSKTYRAAAESFDKDELHAPLAAIKIAKTTSKKKFAQRRCVTSYLPLLPAALTVAYSATAMPTLARATPWWAAMPGRSTWASSQWPSPGYTER